MMKEKLQNIKEEALKAIEAADMPEKLNDVRVKFLGKKGELTAVLKGMKDVAPEDRPKVGQMVNETRAAIEAVLEENKEKMEKAIRAEKLKKEVIDVTLPAKKNCVGHRHPNTIALEEVERVFTGMGYEVVEGPEIEYDEYNFRKLNIPDGHPAKDEQDTDISCTGTYYGAGQASNLYLVTGTCIPFRRSRCNTFTFFPSDRRTDHRQEYFIC